MNHADTSSRPSTPQHGATTSTRDRFADAVVERRGSGSVGGASEPDPQLPHEQDESSHSQASAAASHDRVGGQAYGDLVAGQQDTDKGPEMDRVYNEKVAPDRGPENPRR